MARRNSNSNFRRVAVVAGSIAATSLILPAIVSAQPDVLETIDYASHRADKNKGTVRTYSLLSDATISQDGNKFGQRWYWDIGKPGFGKEEIDAIKEGKLVFMNQAFNDLVNPKLGKFLEIASQYSSLSEELKQEKANSKANLQTLANYEQKVGDLEKQLFVLGLVLQHQTLQPQFQFNPFFPLSPLFSLNPITEPPQTPFLDKYSMQPPQGSMPNPFPTYIPQGTPEIPQAPVIEGLNYSVNNESLPLPKVPETQNNSSNSSLTISFGPDFGLGKPNAFSASYGGTLEMILNFNKIFGLGVKTGIKYTPDKVVDSYAGDIDPVSGFQNIGTTTQTNALSYSVDGVVKVGPIEFIGGMGIDTGLDTTVETIKNSGRNPNTNSSLYTVLSWEAGLGLQLGTKQFKVTPSVKYNNNNGFSAGVEMGYEIPLNSESK